MGRRDPNPPHRPPVRVLPYTVHADAQAAIDVLIDNENFVPDTREQFALRMGWVRVDVTGPTDIPNVQRVKDVCTLTRDLATDSAYGGMVIVYAPSSGGMVLIDPDSPIHDVHLVHLLLGDLQRQQTAMTINQRRVNIWKQVGHSFASCGDHDMARLFWQGEDEINRTGFVAGSTHVAIAKAARARNLVQ